MSITTIPLDVLHKHFGKETYPSTYIKDDLLFIKSYQCVHFPFCLPVFFAHQRKGKFLSEKKKKNSSNTSAISILSFHSPPLPKGNLEPIHRTVRLAVPTAKPKSEIVAKHLKLVSEPQIEIMGILATPTNANTFPPRNSGPYDQGLLTLGFP